MPNFRPKSERAPRALCWFAGSSVARAVLACTLAVGPFVPVGLFFNCSV